MYISVAYMLFSYETATASVPNSHNFAFLYTVVDVSAQGTCTVTPLNPITLTTAGGVLADGSVNVMIQCNCSDDVALKLIRWFGPDGTRLIGTGHRR